MAVKPLKYKLSPEAFKGVTENTETDKGIPTKKWKGKGKSECLVVVTENPYSLFYYMPVIHKGNLYVSTLPLPTSLFLHQAKEFSNNASKLMAKFPDNIKGKMTNENSDELNVIDSNLYYTFLSYKISSLTSLVMFVESYINSIIPEDFEIENSKGIIVDKNEVERNWRIKDKLKEVIPEFTEINSSELYQESCSKFIEINKLRNEFIHLKSTKNKKNMDPYIDHFEELINIDLDKSVKQVERLIKLIDPDYFN